jgi:catechol 2,3-dioxygenase-like lactoylglutathione lyase family enzyme
MRKLQTQGVHHITINGANRQTSIDFWEGVLGMPFVFEQPNLDNAGESHLYFDPGDGRLITVFTNEARVPEQKSAPREPGIVHHLAFSLSQATFAQAVERLDERNIQHSGVKDRGFMDSIYFEDPLGLLVELASYRFEPPSATRTPTCCSRRTSCASSARTRTSTASTSRTPSSGSSRARSVPLGRSLTQEPVLKEETWPRTR